MVLKKISNLTPEEIKACRRLSLGSNGMLSWWLTYDIREKRDSRAALYKVDGVVVGWGLRRFNGEVGYYVANQYRNQGIGTKLVIRTARIGKIIPAPHTPQGRRMFQKAKEVKV